MGMREVKRGERELKEELECGAEGTAFVLCGGWYNVISSR